MNSNSRHGIELKFTFFTCSQQEGDGERVERLIEWIRGRVDSEFGGRLTNSKIEKKQQRFYVTFMSLSEGSTILRDASSSASAFEDVQKYINKFYDYGKRRIVAIVHSNRGKLVEEKFHQDIFDEQTVLCFQLVDL